jgi:histidinol-phosphatase (PHP family)
MLPADGHVHTEWSWDAPAGSMERTCARAVELGLPAVAFTEHVDFTTWVVLAADLDDSPNLRPFTDPDGTLTPGRLDLDGYLESVQRCRDLFPSLHIVTGVELGEPHWHAAQVARLLEAGQFDRVLGSLHCLPLGDRFSEPPYLFRERPAADVLRDYLAETARLIRSTDAFAVLAHVDYPIRSWPGPFDPTPFEDDFRHTLSTLAASDRALEVNTAATLHPEIIRWWRDEGGKAVTFGSDAHDPTRLAAGFPAAAALVEAQGFRPGPHPHAPWTRP